MAIETSISSLLQQCWGRTEEDIVEICPHNHAVNTLNSHVER